VDFLDPPRKGRPVNTLPPEPDPLPRTPPSASERVTAAFERIAEIDRPDLWTTLRAVEDALVDAKAVDERVKAGENLPLAGTVLAVADLIDVAGQPSGHGVPETGATVVARLGSAGAVVLGKSRGAAVAVALGVVDLALSTETPSTETPSAEGTAPAALNAVVALKPTPGLLPATGVRASDGVSVYATGLVAGRRALALMTGPDGADPAARTWPADVRLGAGEHPRIAVLPGLPLTGAARLAFDGTAARLTAWGAVLEPFAPAKTFDALLVPAGTAPRELPWGFDGAAITVPVLPGDRRPFGVTFVTRAFEDQIGLDLATVCTDEPMTPYPEPGEDVVVFGAHLRGQPLNARLTELGARFTGPVRTTGRYRMVLLATEPPQPGVLDDAEAAGDGLDGERWRLSPAAFDRFAATLEEPFVLGRVELADGTRPLAVRCEPAAAASAPGLERYESWRGYVRFASTAGRRDPG
jgi:allophanate hydrolase